MPLDNETKGLIHELREFALTADEGETECFLFVTGQLVDLLPTTSFNEAINMLENRWLEYAASIEEDKKRRDKVSFFCS